MDVQGTSLFHFCCKFLRLFLLAARGGSRQLKGLRSVPVRGYLGCHLHLTAQGKQAALGLSMCDSDD